MSDRLLASLRKRRAFYLVPLAVILLSTVFIWGGKVFSFGEQERLIYLETNPEDSWNMDEPFGKQWYSNQQNVSFVIDLQKDYEEYQATHEGDAQPSEKPFTITAKNGVTTINPERITYTEVKDPEFKGKYVVHVPVAEEGPLNLTFSIPEENAWGISSSQNSFSITTDRTAPVVQLAADETDQGDIRLTVHVNETNFTAKNVSVLVKERYATEPSRIDPTWQKNQDGSWTGTQLFTNSGEYEVTVNAADQAGNRAEAKTLFFDINKKSPELSVTDTDNNQSILASGFSRSKNVELKIVNGISLQEAHVTIAKEGEQGQSQPMTVSKKEATLAYTFAGDGPYVIQATAIDKRGKEYQLPPFRLEVDSTAPAVTVTDQAGKPLQEAYQSEQEIHIQVSDKSLDRNKTVFTGTRTGFDDVKTDLSSSFTKDDAGNLFLKASEDGQYQIVIKAFDQAGNQTSQTVNFTVDKTEPVISDNIEKKYYQQKDFRLSVLDYTLNQSLTKLAVTKTDNGISEDYTSKITDVTIGRWMAVWQHRFTEDGDYAVKVTTADQWKSDQPISKKIDFTIDHTAPVLKVTNVTDNTLYQAPLKDVAISVADHTLDLKQTSLSVKKDGGLYETEPLQVNGETAANRYDFTEDGNYTIDLQSTDLAGNVAKMNPLTFTIDQHGPELTIASLKDGGHYQELSDVVLKATDLTLKKTNLVVKQDGKTIMDDKLEDGKNSFGLKEASKSLDFKDEGDYQLTLTAEDAAGRISEQTLSFTIDHTAPVIGFEGIAKDAFVQKGNLKIGVKEHNYAGNSVEIHVLRKEERNGEALPYEKMAEWKNTGEESSLEHLFTEDGDYEVVVESRDQAGNLAKADWYFTIDHVKPVITISNQSETGAYYNKDKEVTISVQDRNYEGNQVQIAVTKTIDGKEEAVSLDPWKNEAELSNLSHVFHEDGDYVVTVNSVDRAGNVGDPQTVRFTVDQEQPALTISGVEDDHHYHLNQTAKFTLVDRNMNLDDTKLTITKDGETYKETGRFTQAGTTASRSITFSEEGTYSVSLSSKDLAGNETVHPNITFVVDKTKPELAINGVADQSFNPEAKRGVTVSVDERYFSTNHVELAATKNGRPLNIGKWENKAKVSTLVYDFLDDGLYNIFVKAEDKAGNGPVTAEKTFTIDKVKPAIDITGVEDGQYYNTNKQMAVTIKDVNLDVNSIKVTKDGSAYPVGSFHVTKHPYENSIASLSHTFSAEGEYAVTVEATDQAGNSFSRKVTFTIDKTKPVITPKMKGEKTTIEDGAYYNRVFTPSFVLDQPDDQIVSVSLNDGGDIKNHIPVASKEMVYHYKVEARDKAGNEAALTVSFTVDTTKPVLNIKGVVDGFFNKNKSFTVDYSDIHMDESKSSLMLNGKPFEKGQRVSLEKEGDYILKASAVDLASNISSRTIVFAIDKTKPLIKFKEPISDRYFNKNLIPQLLIDDMSDYDIISLTLDGEPYQLGDKIKKEGKHVLFFEVKDKAGNIQQLSVEFIIDKTAPKVIVEGVKKSTKYFEPVTVKFRLDNPSDVMKSITVNGKLLDGETSEENGFQVVKAKLSAIQTYHIKVTAYDEAGNETVTDLPFEIAEKGLLGKYYDNKPLLASSIGVVAAALVAATAGIIRRGRRKQKTEEEQE